MNRKLYIKILIALVLSFATATLLKREVFIADTPKVKPDLQERLVARIKDARKGNLEFIGQIFDPRTLEQKLQNVPLQQLTKGVYAKSKGNISYTEIKQGQVEWREYSFVVDGKTVKIRVPKGESPPPQESVENIYR